MLLNEFVKMSLVGVTAGNKGLNVYQACEKIYCEGLIYTVNSYVKLLVNLCYKADTRGVVNGVKTGAHQATFCYNIGSVGNFQENVKVLFGLNNKILKEKKDWKAYDIHIPLPTRQVINEKLNFCIFLNYDADSRENEKMDIVCSCSTISKRSIRFILITKGSLAANLQFLVCALHIDSYDMKIFGMLICIRFKDSVRTACYSGLGFTIHSINVDK
ncbi:hypothetical protein Tco_1101335 [Tanacetum coccineum]